MKWFSQGKWLLVGFGSASLLMAVVNSLSYQNATQLIQSTNRSQQTYEVIKNLVDVLSDMTIAESGRRGFVFLNDHKERLRYQRAITHIEQELQTLQQQLAHHPQQRSRLKELRNLLYQRIQLFEQSIQLHQRNHNAMAHQNQLTLDSVLLRDQIQASIAEMQQEEEDELRQWLQDSQASIRNRMWIEFLMNCSSFAILAISCLLLYRQLVKRQEAEAFGRTLEREKELSDLKLRFFSMVSHEFRTPLSIILGSAQMLAENNPHWTDDRRLKNIHRIQSSAHLMTHHLSDILTLTRAEAGNLDCKPEPLDVEAFCLNLIEDLQLTEATGHKLQFHRENQWGLVHLDEKLLFSILSNLVLNAVKYSEPGSTIQLKLRYETEGVLFEVIDSGIGIALSEQPNLYTPFYRGTNTSDVEGTGLGLVVVKKCVEVHGGEIRVSSQVGVGTTFRVWLPNRHAALPPKSWSVTA